MSAFLVDAPTGFIGASGVWGAAIPNGAPFISFPLQAQNNYARVYTQPLIVHTGADVTGSIGSVGRFPNTILVAEGDREPVGAGFVTFSQQHAEIPSGFNDFESYVGTFPALGVVTGLLGTVAQRTYWKTAPVTVRVYHDYINTNNPAGITLSGAQAFRNVYGFDALSLDSTTNPTFAIYSGWVASGVEFIAQDSELTRYIGPIWQRRTYYVKAK